MNQFLIFSRKFLMTLTLLSAITLSGFAQNVAWIRQFIGNPGESHPNDLVSDIAGNVYVTGYFDDQVDFDPGPNEMILTSNGDHDAFIMKLDPQGNLAWVKQIGGSGTDRGLALVLGLDGSIFATGSFVGVVDLDPGPGVQLTPASQGGGYLLKLNSLGEILWEYHCSGDGSVPITHIAQDPIGHIYLAGGFRGMVNFDTKGEAKHTAVGQEDAFLISLTGLGQFSWAHAFGGILFDRAINLAADGSGPYLSIFYFTSFDVDPGPGEFILPHHEDPNFDAAVIKFGMLGDFEWAKSYTGPGTDVAGAGVAPDGNIIITAAGKSSLFDTEGMLLVDSLPPFQRFDTDSLTLRAGNFVDTIDFDPTEDELIRISTRDLLGTGRLQDLFAIKYGADLRPLWLVTIGSPEQLLNRGVSFITDNVIYLSSEHFYDLLVDDNGDTTLIPGDGSCDMFIVKFRTCSPSITNLNQEACGSFVFGNDSLTTSGTYEDTFVSAAGCDSIVRLQLTIHQSTSVTVDTMVCGPFNYHGLMIGSSGVFQAMLMTKNGCDSLVRLQVNIIGNSSEIMQQDTLLVALEENATYQWLDCNMDYAFIQNATSKSYKPEINGDYAVEISKNGCADTSSCFSTMITSTRSKEFLPIIVLPNPVKETLMIDHFESKNGRVEIWSIDGVNLFSSRDKIIQTVDVSSLNSGIYLLRVYSESEIFQTMFVKV